MIKIKVHSVVDIITNSSTEIYTNYDSSVKPFKEMVNEFLKVLGVDKTCDEVFKVVALPEVDYILSAIDELKDEDYKKYKNYIYYEKSKWGDLKRFNLEKFILECDEIPDFIKSIETAYDENILYIVPLSEEYEDLAKKIKTFLDSPGHDAYYDG